MGIDTHTHISINIDELKDSQMCDPGAFNDDKVIKSNSPLETMTVLFTQWHISEY